MEQLQETGLFGFDSQTPDPSGVFEQDGTTNVTPKNEEEVTAQLAVANDKDEHLSYDERVKSRQRDVSTSGVDPQLQEVVKQEREDQVVGARKLAQEKADQRDVVGLELAAQLIKQARERLGETPTRLDGLRATAHRSIEAVGLQYAAPRYKNLQAFDEAVSTAADSVTLRNLVGAAQSELDGQTSLWEKVSHFAGSVLVQPLYEVIGQKTLNKVTGGEGVNPLNSYTSVQELRTFFLGLRPEERVEVVKGLMKEEMGIVGENKSANIELLRKLGEMTAKDGSVDAIFNTLNIIDAAQIGKLLFSAVRRGVPAKAVADVAGDEAAAKVVLRDLTTGGKAGGLNDSELIARLLAMGKNPLDADPAAFAGMSAAGQTELRKAWDQLIETTRNRLVSSGLTPDEVRDGLAAVRSQYSAETNKAIHSVIFGEGDELGQKMSVFWQGQDGRAFGSKEAAEAWAKAEGKVDYEVVPKNISAKLSMTVQQMAGPSGELDLLKVLKANRDKIDSVFTRMVVESDGDPMTSQIADIWKAAAKSDKNIYPSAQTFLKVIAGQSDDAAERLLARELLAAGTSKGIRWDKLMVRAQLGGMDAGGYWQNLDYVVMHANHLTNSQVMLHEFIHAHNAQVVTLVAGDRALAKRMLSKEVFSAGEDLVELHKRFNEWFKKKQGIGALKEQEQRIKDFIFSAKGIDSEQLEAALKLPQEFITYGLTNPEIRKWLQSVKMSDLGYTSKETVWSELWDVFKRLLGWKADDTALAKLVGAHDRLLASIDEGARTSISSQYKAGKVGDSFVANLVDGSMLEARAKKPKPIGKALDKEIEKEQKRILNDGLSPTEIVKAQKRIEELRAARDAKVAPSSPTEEWLVKEQRQDPISFANVGKFSDEDIRSMPWLAIDPKHQASEFAVEERVIGVHAEAKTRRDLTSFLTPYFDKLSKAGKVRVKAILEEGDAFSNAGGAVGKEFTYSELRARGLNEVEAQAYFAARQVRMVSYHLRNGEMVRALRAEGYREIEFLGTGERHAGKVLDQDQAGQALGRVIHDTVTGGQYLVDSKTIEDSYKAGKKIVQLRQPTEIGGKHYSFVLVDDTTAKGREIVTALHYRPGEFSRIYSDQYFITVKKLVDVDGRMQEMMETVRTATSAREAQEYVTAHRKAIELLMDSQSGKVVLRNINQELEKLVGRYTDPAELKMRFDKGELNGYTGMDFHYTRNREEFLNGSISEAMTNGRLFTSKRSNKLFSVDRDRRNTLDVYESLEAEITNISRVANISMWRDNMIRRWMNTFGSMVPNRTGNDVADFFSAAGAAFTKGSPEAQFAERTHRYIVRQLGVKTQEEKYWEGMTRVLTEKLFTGNEPIETIGAKIRTMSWLGFIRNVNFNLNLGMFNPAQLIVQANGAVTAAILSPLHGAKAASTFPLLRMALMSDNPDVWRKLARIEKIKNLGLSSEDEFFKLVGAIRKAGILDNVRSTALWNLEDGALNVFAGYPKRALQSNTFFFNRGEEFSRVVSFDVARREWMEKNPGQAWNSNAALKQIVVRMDDLTQNMTKANLARFQEGVLSIPLQFAQYNIKLAANVMSAFVTKGQGRGFSKMEATQLLLGHIMLYGAAGNGLVWVADEVLGNATKDKLPQSAKEIMSQGMIAWLLDKTAETLTGEGAKVALGSRLGSFDYYQRIGEAIFKDPGNFYEAMLGPTVSAAKRIGVFGEVASLWRKDPDLTLRDVLEGLAKMGTEQVATLRNAAKAYLYMQHQGKMLDRQGVAIGKVNSNELLAQALGFQPTVAVDVNNLIKTKKDHNEALDDIAKTILRVQRDILTASKSGDMKRADEQRKLLNALWPENAGDFMDVQRRVRDRLYPYETEMQRLLGEYILKGQTYNKPVVVTEQPKKAE